MSQDREKAPHGSAAQRMFGAQAPIYATSHVHVHDASLDALRRLAGPGPFRWAVDLGTGAGFTAFAMSECAGRVVATDLTRPMLEQARRLGQERKLGNLSLVQTPAEALPFAGESLDLVTCRVAFHHFTNLEQALDEVRRVLKPGGALVVADSVSPEDDAVSRWMNDVELRRDFSHMHNRKVSQWETMLAERGLTITGREMPRIHLEFNDWVARTATPKAEITALRRDFLHASAPVRKAFQIQPAGDDIHFSWPCLVFRAVKA
ncbi:MAG: class I SAM-dependent methyltransferase [Dehalococcoidia bacterium]|nr:class I SAM-dependent methyltransferase [Dehalococcoidia bacterium]MSQ17741.1 class I SAM-dependent methyltransferase [Dehalococcoidia bacterium]